MSEQGSQLMTKPGGTRLLAPRTAAVVAFAVALVGASTWTVATQLRPRASPRLEAVDLPGVAARRAPAPPVAAAGPRPAAAPHASAAPGAAGGTPAGRATVAGLEPDRAGARATGVTAAVRADVPATPRSLASKRTGTGTAAGPIATATGTTATGAGREPAQAARWPADTNGPRPADTSMPTETRDPVGAGKGDKAAAGQRAERPRGWHAGDITGGKGRDGHEGGPAPGVAQEQGAGRDGGRGRSGDR